MANSRLRNLIAPKESENFCFLSVRFTIFPHQLLCMIIISISLILISFWNERKYMLWYQHWFYENIKSYPPRHPTHAPTFLYGKNIESQSFICIFSLSPMLGNVCVWLLLLMLKYVFLPFLLALHYTEIWMKFQK